MKNVVLNKNFHSVFTKEIRFEEDENEQISPHTVECITIKAEIIKEELRKLGKRKANGNDEILYWVLQKCTEELCKTLCHIFRESTKQSKVPDIRKNANTVPLF